MESSIIDTGEKNANRKSTLQNDLLEMYEKKLSTDVNICVENSFVCFSAHKLILATRSPVFADILWKNPESKPEIIKIEGISIQVLPLLLWYIYTDELKANSPEELRELAKVAQQYEIGGLVRACKARIAQHPIDKNNVFTLMEAFKYFKLEFLFDKCVHFINSVSPIVLFKTKEFLNISHESLSQILKRRHTSNESDIYVMEGVIHWLQHRNKRDRSLLSEFDIFSLNCDNFLDLVEKFPTFFTSREIACILRNMIRPGLTNLPPWCKTDFSSDENRTEQSIEDKSLSEDCFRRSIMSTSLEIKTDCRRAFLKSYFYEEDGFDGSVIFEIKLSSHFPQRPYLVMLELAFGSDYVPRKNLELELFRHEQCAVFKKKKISFLLHVNKDHYYVIVNRHMRIQKNHPLVFSLKFRVTGLTKWKINGPVSNRQFRVARIPEDIFYNMCLDKPGYKSVCLTPLNDWIILIDPARGDKRAVVTSLYFNSCHKTETN